MKLVALLLFMFVASPILHAQPRSSFVAVWVGGTQIRIPVPAGFSAVSEGQSALWSLAEQSTPPTNRLLAVFHTPADIQAHAAGEFRALERYLSAQTYRPGEWKNLSMQEFAQVRRIIRTQQEEISRKAGPVVAELAQKASRAHGVKIDIPFGEIVPLGIVEETASSLSFAALSSVRIRVGSHDDKVTMVGVSSMLYVKGRMLFLYTYSTLSGEADVEWARKVAIAWKNDLFAINR